MSQNNYTMDDFREEMRRRTGAPPPRERPKRAPYKPVPRKRETWAEFCARLLDSCRARLAELADRKPTEVMPCPWAEALRGDCLKGCKCGGAKAVTVEFMIEHYRQVITEFTR